MESVSDVNTFTLVYAGEVNMSGFVTGTSNTDEEVYFLSSETAGHLSAFAPTTSGHVIKPILTRRGTDAGTSIQRGIVTNYIGTVIGGEATVSLQGLVPVGVIQSWAGTSSGVPEGWGMYDGGTVDAFVYAEYFQAVGTRYGVQQRLTIPSLSAEPNSIQGLEIKQINSSNSHEIKGQLLLGTMQLSCLRSKTKHQSLVMLQVYLLSLLLMKFRAEMLCLSLVFQMTLTRILSSLMDLLNH